MYPPIERTPARNILNRVSSACDGILFLVFAVLLVMVVFAQLTS